MPLISCPKCEATTFRGGYSVWKWLVAILFFPFGLLAMVFGRKPTRCPQCHYIWQT